MCAVPRRTLRLTTERLTIRPLARQDITEFTRYRNLPDVALYQDWTLPYTRDLAHALVDDAEQLGTPTPGEWLQLGVVDEQDRLLGDVAIWLDASALLAMIGYTLAPASQGKGYATEAVRAVVDWLFTTRKVHRVAATIDPANVASARVLERNGFRYIGTAKSAALVRGVWSDDSRFEILAGEWRAWKRRPGRPRRVELVEITADTVRRVGELDRAFSQRRFVSSVYQSYGDALVPPTHEGARITPWFRAIYADGEPVGFMMVAEPLPTQPHPYLWRLMVDWRHQERGIGRAAIQALAQRWAAEGATHLLLSCTADVTGSPEPFYRRLGFERTGTFNESGETEMIAAIDRLLPAQDNGESDRSPRMHPVSDTRKGV
jgi:RimJ/RimL family protein N-acetyltransferase/ribosomal protein S18 acetylase RimI-like enzyme